MFMLAHFTLSPRSTSSMFPVGVGGSGVTVPPDVVDATARMAHPVRRFRLGTVVAVLAFTYAACAFDASPETLLAVQ